MKNKKYLVGLFVLVALLCLGIGYANVFKVLTIDGTVSTADDESLSSNFILYFNNYEIDTGNGKGATAGVTGGSGSVFNSATKPLLLEFTVGNLSVIGSYVKLTYEIKNDSKDFYANSPTFAMDEADLVKTGEEFNGNVYTAYEFKDNSKFKDPVFIIYVRSLPTTKDNKGNDTGSSSIYPGGGTGYIEVIVMLARAPLSQTSIEFDLTATYSGSDIPATS